MAGAGEVEEEASDGGGDDPSRGADHWGVLERRWALRRWPGVPQQQQQQQQQQPETRARPSLALVTAATADWRRDARHRDPTHGSCSGGSGGRRHRVGLRADFRSVAFAAFVAPGRSLPGAGWMCARVGAAHLGPWRLPWFLCTSAMLSP
ncbi:hypothetical protein PLESTB_001376200 [Pleodorina starrii]|uniref:Uncharacterized protein n=1 Tax=Pleodorina starrii TaxID=330485 RepID=A0A9W6F7E9_9CHLO|nr:hypothetical protein PLESTB_001376200 [Pleodorina starrii]